jgi:hypothetical protein
MKKLKLSLLLCCIAPLPLLAHADMNRFFTNSITVANNKGNVGLVDAFFDPAASGGIDLKPGQTAVFNNNRRLEDGTITLDVKNTTMHIPSTCLVKISMGETLEFMGNIDKNGNASGITCIHYYHG